MSDDLVAVVVVLGVVVSALVLIGVLSARDTRSALDGPVRVQDPAKRRWGAAYLDPDDPRVWVPRPAGNGWDPNLATTGGRLVLAALLGIPLAVVAAALLLA
ncbi:hypothetical protein [Arsenicicoccus dermatophilus]|uniref:hypothetical protein n=1 Tax=Arsenicicoccus dermatophilus TaxID=1076331 RepID=UPI003916F78D